jgi:Fusaric acid resistance protein-like
MRLTQWLGQRDRGLSALRRAGRAAIVMPAMFALGDKVIDNPALATFAAFGSFAMLLLVDFTGPMRERLEAQAGLAVVGAVFVCLGTLAARNAWLAAAAMAVVGFGVLFAGVVSSVLASATPSLLLAFILPVSLPGPVSSIPDRLEGWSLASGAAFAAVALLWPAPARDPLRAPATAACRALAARLRADVAYMIGGADAPTAAEHDQAAADAAAAVAALQRGFLATPYRPTGLSTGGRTVVRLVDEMSWLNAIATKSGSPPRAGGGNPATCRVKIAAATVLERGADLLDSPSGSPDALHSALAELRLSLLAMEQDATVTLPVVQLATSAEPVAVEERIGALVSSLDPSFRSQELSFAVSQIGSNIELTAAAEQRGWLDRLLGRQPQGLTTTLSAAQERAVAHVERHSVWLHNSVRGAIGLALAVLVADLTGVQHSFWVVLGTLSVLRSNALNTGQNIVRGLLGTVAGVVVGALLLVIIGTNTTVLWLLLPLAILVAGVAPAAISFAAGQAAFTLTLVILFNIIQPTGWHVGLVRIEDIAIGCAVSLLVGLLFWPRGAAAALGQALAEAYTDSARYLAQAVDFGMECCDFRPPGTGSPSAPMDEAVRAAAASRRLDDTFRGYLAERGPKRAKLAEVASLVTGVVGLRLTADAVLDLWQRDDGSTGGDREAARAELLASTGSVVAWYDGLATALLGRGDVPEPLAHDRLGDERLIVALRRDLGDEDGKATATAVRMIWTGDHLDAARRLQSTLVGPARAAHGDTGQRAARSG